MFRWLVNAIFLALPIGTTIGVLLGIQALNSANGKPPPLSNGDKDSNSIGIPGLGPIKHKDSIAMKCDDPEGIYSKAPKGLDFSCTLCVDTRLSSRARIFPPVPSEVFWGPQDQRNMACSLDLSNTTANLYL